MKSLFAAALAIAIASAAPARLAVHAQPAVPEIEFDSVPDFLKLPEGMNFGEVSGRGGQLEGPRLRLHALEQRRRAGLRAGGGAAARVRPDAASSSAEIGKGLYAWSFAHTVRVDRDDNIWAVDKGSDMVVKFNPAGRVDDGVRTPPRIGRRRNRTVGTAGPAARATSMACSASRPTWRGIRTGNIYISDGYINSRVAKYDRNGDWVKSWGERGTGPGQFRLPHAIAIDRNDNVYVGDRSNRRIQVFDADGQFLRMFTIDVPPPPGTRPVNGNTPTGAALANTIGAPNSICITPGAESGDVRRREHVPGRLFKVSLDGKVLGVIGRSGRQLKQFSGVHQLACPSEREVYAAETSNWRVQKLILR